MYAYKIFSKGVCRGVTESVSWALIRHDIKFNFESSAARNKSAQSYSQKFAIKFFWNVSLLIFWYRSTYRKINFNP